MKWNVTILFAALAAAVLAIVLTQQTEKRTARHLSAIETRLQVLEKAAFTPAAVQAAAQ